MGCGLAGAPARPTCFSTMIQRERQRWLANQLPSSASNAAAVRFFGTQLLTVRIDLDA